MSSPESAAAQTPATTPSAAPPTPPTWDGLDRIEGWLLKPLPSAQAALTMPEPGNVYVARLGEREPYASSPTFELIEAHSFSTAALANLLSCPSSDSIAITSALEGFVSKLSAMARAVRNRSYVLMAASTSDCGALALLNRSSLRSKASVASLTDIASFLLVEIDHCADASAAPTPALTFTTLPALGAALDGGTYRGLITQPDGTTVAVIQLTEWAGNLTHPEATKWAELKDAQLPTRPVAALLFANAKADLRARTHWTCETLEFDASYAWYCLFYHGNQDYDHKSAKACAVAVRLIPITA